MALSVSQARAEFAASVQCEQGIELLPLYDALGRIAAEDVFAAVQVPPTDNSAMDGYAVHSADILSVPTELPVHQRITAGGVAEPLLQGSAARIFTGGVIPAGADAVVIQENCDIADGQGRVSILEMVSAGQNIRPAGQDIRLEDLVVRKGQQLRAIDLGLLASVGEPQVAVFSKLKVAIFSTGDELAEPGQTLRPGQIYNSNRTMLLALCKQLGFEAIDCGIVEDSLGATKAALSVAAARADIVISSGGVSVGEEDHIRPALEALGEIKHWKVQMKPGKPVVLGSIDKTPFLGLPGNPVSAFVVFQLLGVPLIQSLQGAEISSLNAIDVPASFNKAGGSREEYIRVRLNYDSGRPVAELFENQSSGVLFSLAWADGLVRQQIGQTINVSEMVEFLPLRHGML